MSKHTFRVAASAGCDLESLHISTVLVGALVRPTCVTAIRTAVSHVKVTERLHKAGKLWTQENGGFHFDPPTLESVEVVGRFCNCNTKILHPPNRQVGCSLF